MIYMVPFKMQFKFLLAIRKIELEYSIIKSKLILENNPSLSTTIKITTEKNKNI